MSAILIAALVMSVLGLLFGALLGVTGRVFKPMKRLPCIQQGIIRHWPVRAVGIDADPETHVLR